MILTNDIKQTFSTIGWSRALAAGIAAALLGSSAASASIVTNVSVGDNFFAPKSLSISVSDQVKWTWTGSAQHSSTSNTGLWNSGLHGKGGTFMNTFNSAGSFPYHCTVHSGQVGTITVQAAADTAPSVTISGPTNGAVFPAPASFVLSATASDPDGTVAGVEFFQGNTSLGIATSVPYGESVLGLAPGDYTFSAVATDNGGLKATNSITVHVVAPVPAALSAPARLADSTFQFSFSATPGVNYVVQRSTDLLQWTGISTNLASASLVVVQDSNSPAGAAYYRVGVLPNF